MRYRNVTSKLLIDSRSPASVKYEKAVSDIVRYIIEICLVNIVWFAVTPFADINLDEI